LTIFLRESLYQHEVVFHALWGHLAITLFLWLLLIRSLQKWIRKQEKKQGKKRILILLLSLAPIAYWFYEKWFGIWYYFRDFFLYALPTILLFSVILTYGIRLVRKQDRITLNFLDLPPHETPMYVLIEGKALRVESREKVHDLCQKHGQIFEDVQVITSRTSPFGHFIFISFLCTALSSVHLAYEGVSLWFRWLSDIWEFLRRFL
jgi:hypothetical protein